MTFKVGDRVVDPDGGDAGTITRPFGYDNAKCWWVEWDVKNPDDHDEHPCELWVHEQDIVPEREWQLRQGTGEADVAAAIKLLVDAGYTVTK